MQAFGWQKPQNFRRGQIQSKPLCQLRIQVVYLDMNLKFKLSVFIISLYLRVNASFEMDQVYYFTMIQKGAQLSSKARNEGQ